MEKNKQAGKMAEFIAWLPREHEDLGWDYQYLHKMGVAKHI